MHIIIMQHVYIHTYLYLTVALSNEAFVYVIKAEPVYPNKYIHTYAYVYPVITRCVYMHVCVHACIMAKAWEWVI